MYRVHNAALPWTQISAWRWPAADKKLVQVFDHVADIDVFMKYVKNPRVCIQAGGACGIWPLRYSMLFDHVFTFEPLEVNYKCLLYNCESAGNITAFNMPLSNDYKKYRIHNDAFERENLGAGYIVEDENGIESTRIDDLHLVHCDLIQLDVEGHELEALQGAAETIEKHRPVIVLEEKPLNHMRNWNHRAPREYLETMFGYKQVDAIHRDIVLC